MRLALAIWFSIAIVSGLAAVMTYSLDQAKTLKWWEHFFIPFGVLTAAGILVAAAVAVWGWAL